MNKQIKYDEETKKWYEFASHDNGSINYIVSLHNGKRNGLYESFNKNGIKEKSIYYENGKQKSLLVHNKDKIIYEAKYDDNGILYHEIHRQINRFNEHELIHDHKQSTKYLAWYRLGQTYRQEIYKNNSMSYYSEISHGEKIEHINTDTKQQKILYHKSGIKSREETSDANFLHIRYWDINGNLYYEYKFDNIARQIVTQNFVGLNCIIPDGDVVVWKACRLLNGTNVYVKLLVPAASRRITLRLKCRVEYAQILEITDLNDNHYNTCQSFIYSPNKTIYTVGEVIYADKFDDDTTKECSHGINVHLFKELCDQWF